MNKGNTYNKHMPVLINASSILYEGGGSILEDYLNELFLKVYPVGTIYTSTSDINPTEYFGGTWETFGSGRTLVGVDTTQTEFNSVEKTGGSKYLQRHHHEGLTFWNKSVSLDAGTKDGYNLSYGNTIVSGRENAFFTNEAGEGDSGNLQPYITVYFWRRTA